MSVLLSPIGNGINFLSTTGQPLAGGKLNTYQAGSSTPLATYTDVNGLIPNTNPVILGTDGRLPSELWLTQGYSYKFTLTDSANNLIATYDNLYGILANATTTTSPFSTGMIMIWSGAIGTIPAGWVICDGNNGSPDLRDRFVIGAGNTYSVSQTGGSADAVVVSHTHTATSVVTDPGHFHTYTRYASLQIQTGSSTLCWTGTSTINTSTATTGITVATTNSTAGVSGTNANLPPYYALCYIMKT